MANTYTCLDYQLVFSTKNRHPWISADIEARVWEYLAGIAYRNGMHPYEIGGVEDHLHLAVSIPATIAVCNAMQLLKGGSSKWIHDTFPDLRGFAWQDGYAAFSVSKSQRPKLIDYIANQREHHRELSFQDELRAMFRLHGIEFDERYAWG